MLFDLQIKKMLSIQTQSTKSLKSKPVLGKGIFIFVQE